MLELRVGVVLTHCREVVRPGFLVVAQGEQSDDGLDGEDLAHLHHLSVLRVV